MYVFITNLVATALEININQNLVKYLLQNIMLNMHG